MTETRVEIVVTVPEELPRDLLIPTAMRTTLGVLVELIVESSNRVVLASPFLQLESICRGPLGLALGTAAARGVLIDVVSMGGHMMELDMVALSPQRSPMTVRVSHPKPNLVNSEVMGSHAKFCLVDGAAAYIGSANFTENGLTKHFELGTLVRGQAATDLWSVVVRLFHEGFFVPCGWLHIDDARRQYRPGT
jgi:phosphatidylserine/phosphatidylglycerophosphate/cardiolipin synthase-like enzyme